MSEFIWSVVTKRAIVGASDTTTLLTMPVLPLSCITLTIEARLISANTIDNWLTLLAQIKSVQFRYRGTQIWAMSGTNLARLVRAAGVFTSRPENPVATAGARRYITLCIPFGRRLFNPMECFPGVAKGETELFIDWTAASALYNNLAYTVETLQLVDAQPKAFLRATTLQATPSATGDVDFDLPRAAPIIGLGITQTNSEPLNALSDVEAVKILGNNQDLNYSQIFGPTARALSGLNRQMGIDYMAHTHIENTAAAYAQNATSNVMLSGSSLERDFMWLDFDPNDDGMYAIDAAKYQDLKARITFNTAATIQILPLELWTPSIIFRR